MSKYLLLCCLCFSGLALSLRAQTHSVPSIQKLHITDTRSHSVFGVYVIHKEKSWLITTTDIDGECEFRTDWFAPGDSIQFQGMGYKVATYTVADLKHLREIHLEELNFLLDEMTVSSISMEELLNKAISQINKPIRNQVPLCRFYGRSQYEKITVYHDRALESRREFGYYFTSGNVRCKNVWDKAFRSYFIPTHSARSLNLTNDGSDTLSPLYITTEETRFDAGTRKIFTLMRTVQLYAPLFSSLRFYEIHPMDSDSLDYVFSFQTKPSHYPDDIRISCKGSFTLDYATYRLKNMTFDYIDYQLFRQVILTDRRKTASPFSTKATLTFGYTPEGEIYIRSCHQETKWKHDLGKDFILIEQPSRMHPAFGKLIEKEAFYDYEYLPVQESLQTQTMLSKIHVIQRNPIGTYEPAIFHALPILLDNEKAIADLNQFKDIEQQFQENSEKTYYPDNYINGFNGFGGKGRADKGYQLNLRTVRRQLFELFPLPQTTGIAKPD